MNRAASTVRYGLVLALVLAGAYLGLTAHHSTLHGGILGFPACASEDSDNCYWDAANRGNGQGTSFLAINGTTIPLD